jgi:flagellar FliL protein
MGTRMAADVALDKNAAPDEDAAEGSGKKGKSKKKLLLFAGIPVVLLLAGGGAFMSGALDGLLGGGEEQATEDGAEAGHGEEDDGSGEEGEHGEELSIAFFDVPDMLVNLNTNGRQNAFLKVQIALELESAEDIDALTALMPRIVDSFQVYLRELRPEELKGSEGLYRLKEELLLRVNKAAAPIHVRDVLFKSVLVQ